MLETIHAAPRGCVCLIVFLFHLVCPLGDEQYETVVMMSVARVDLVMTGPVLTKI